MKLLSIALLLFFFGCKHGHHENLSQKMKKYTTPIADPIPPELADNLYTGPTEPTQIQGAAKVPFEVATRTDKMKQFPCSNCHKNGIVKKGAKRNHWDKKIHHASGMKCATCHNTKGEMELYTFKEKKVNFNHSYKLCQQCHFQQVEDWTGGAHGKRLKGWAGKRKIENCASCHNPHKPAFGKRLPSIEMPKM